MSATEADLILAAKAGDEAAFGLLWQTYLPKVQAVVALRLGAALRRRVSVADVVQETMAAAHQGLPGYTDEGEGAFGRWLAGIASHKLLSQCRRHVDAQRRSVRAEVTAPARPATHQIRAVQASPSQVAMAAELQDRARAAIASLPAEYREVLRLIQGEHLTMQEAADRMGRTRDSIKGLYSRALKRLADELRDDGRHTS